ncbi:MAG: DUF4180 domain-containing protein [Caldilineaceae bacterium]|nr:DUF4180 domain-containing protein [Caldilineaceae bacterium]MBP8106465.1 DUF4180 domain-containing protein [Caldilineaceae bacterium]MBP8122674.1 DUF4180 domain-containing protein [Caldilineaceae bacterium]MBP9072006.1 DUF4180 domain-containing protein [Caldilineaceae bacterium]
MELNIIDANGHPIAEVIADRVVVEARRDALDFLGDVYYQGSSCVILKKGHLPADFYDLRTGLAGEILGMAANYHMKLAVIGDFSQIESKSFAAFVVECNRGNAVFFVSDRETAIKRLAGRTPTAGG